MSFILDALRKSENERQQDAVPSVTRVPLATRRHNLPRWALGVIVLLAACVVVVAGAWWRSVQGTTPFGAEAADRPAERLVQTAPVQPPAQRTPTVQPAAAERRQSASASVPLHTLAEAAAETARPPREAPAAGQQRPQAAPAVRVAPPEETADVLSASDLAARGISLPPLTLELHSFGREPAQRFVFINGNKYQEGETLAEGPRLMHISQGGAVLRYQGADFELTRD